MMEIEKSLTESLGTRVIIENRPQGGRLLIEFFSSEDLAHIVGAFAAKQMAEEANIEAGSPRRMPRERSLPSNTPIKG
jgi:hypothetical protein